MSKSQRTKGAAGEREWCAKLAEHGIIATRLLGQARDGGGDVPAPPILWEVKRRRGMGFYPWLTQANVAVAECRTRAAMDRREDGIRIPAVAARADNQRFVVIIDADDFLRLLTTGKL